MELKINDQTITVAAEPDLPLLWVLRDLLGMTGTKFGCGMALCGACTVLVDGQALRSCVLPVAQAAGKKITTIEGIGALPVGAALQGAWQQINVPQCGAIAKPGRSCLPPRCFKPSRTQAMPISMPPCPGISADAALTRAFAPPSNRLPIMGGKRNERRCR